MSKFTLIQLSDWDGLYVDDKLVWEGHSLDTEDTLRTAQQHGPVTSVESHWIEDDEWIDNLAGNLPKDLKEVPLS